MVWLKPQTMQVNTKTTSYAHTPKLWTYNYITLLTTKNRCFNQKSSVPTFEYLWDFCQIFRNKNYGVWMCGAAGTQIIGRAVVTSVLWTMISNVVKMQITFAFNIKYRRVGECFVCVILIADSMSVQSHRCVLFTHQPENGEVCVCQFIFTLLVLKVFKCILWWITSAYMHCSSSVHNMRVSINKTI